MLQYLLQQNNVLVDIFICPIIRKANVTTGLKFQQFPPKIFFD